MDLIWLVYLIDTVLPFFNTLHILLIVCVCLFLSMYFICFMDAKKEEQEGIVKEFLGHKKWLGIILAIIVSLSLLPKKDTAYKMVAAYGATELVKLEETKELGGKAYKVVNKILDGYLDEQKEDK